MKKWYVLYTKPRNEKKVSDRLSQEGYDIYCPLIKTLRQWSDRKKKVEIPMFSSYVFAYIKEQDRGTIIQDPGVLNFVYWLGKPAIVRESEIEAIKRIAQKGSDIKVEGSGFERGQFVTIPDGPFKGLTGRIDKIDNSKVLVYIEQLGCVVMFRYERELEKV